MWAEKKAVALFFVSHFRGGLKELLWFADVTLHSIWRESLPGAGTLLCSLVFSPGCGVKGAVCAGKPHRVDTSMASKWGRNALYVHTLILACKKHDGSHSCDCNHCTYVILTLWQAFKVMILPNSFCFTLMSHVNMHEGKSCSFTHLTLHPLP